MKDMSNVKRTISIALATYNGDKYIAEQLDSILAQDCDFEELIVCDDCSTDSTWDILEHYAQLDSRIRLFRNSQNLGFKKNFESAILKCKSEYVALCDQDDIWMPNHLSLLIDAIGDKAVACGDSLLIDSNGKSLGVTLSYVKNLDYIPEDDIDKAYFIFYYENPYQGASMLLRTDFVHKVLPISQNVQFHDTWFGGLACFLGGLSIVRYPITKYRQHLSNVTRGSHIRRSRIRTMIGHLLFKREYMISRLEMVNNIERLRSDLSPKEKSFVQSFKLYHQNRSNIFGRFINLLFEIKRFKVIFAKK